MVETTDPLHYVAAIVAGKSVDGLCPEVDSNVDPSDRWQYLARLAISQGLGPLLLQRLQGPAHGVPAAFSQDALTLLIAERNQVAVHYMLAAHVQRKITRVFGGAQLPCIWLKGIALAQTVYAAPELRPMVDVDVLVPYDRREEALALAQSAGFDLETPLLFDGREGLKHHFYLESKAHSPVRLEVHYRLLGTMDRVLTVEDQGWFWHNVYVVQNSDGEMATLRPEAHLLYLCAHAMLQHGEYDLRLLRLYDLDRLVTMNTDFDWDFMIGGAVRMRWTYAVERALRLTEEYFGTPLPPQVLVELAARRPTEERVEFVRRRQSQRTTTEAVVHNLIAMSWSDRIRSGLRIVAPPPQYMRWRYDVASDRDLPEAYLRRIRHMASDAYRSIGRKVRRSR